MLDPRDLLQDSISTISERGLTYGGIEDNFRNIAEIANKRLAPYGVVLTPYMVAEIMVAVKEARLLSSPYHRDSHIDRVAYTAFAAALAFAEGETPAEKESQCPQHSAPKVDRAA